LRGPGRSAVLWSILGALCLCGLLVDLALLTDLLATRGNIDLTPERAATLREQLEDVTPAAIPEPEQMSERSLIAVRGQGLLPALIRSDGRPIWSSMLRWSYVRLPSVRENVSALWLLILEAIFFGVLMSISLARARAMTFRVAMQAAALQRKSIHRQTLRLGPGDLGGDSRRTAQQLFHEEVDKVRDGIMAWGQSIVRDPVVVVFLLLLALATDWQVTFQCLVPLAACWWLVHRQRSLGQSARRLAESSAEGELRVLAESLNKTRIVRGYNMETFEQEQFEKHLDRFTRDVSSGRRHEGASIWVSRLLTVLCLGLVLYFVGVKVLATTNPLPMYAAALLVMVFGCLLTAVESLLLLPGIRQSVNTSADKIYRYLARAPEVGQSVGAKFLDPVSKSIIFESVNYKVNGQSVLSDFELRLMAGTSTALVSVDPLPAHAVAYLLPRFIEPQGGRVLFDSEDINWVTLESIRAETIYVGGSDPFFTGTVLENITCGQQEYSLQDATEAAKMVHAHKFIAALPNGYETVIGEHGESLSAGQGFLLGLARAIVRNPAVLIIEEPLTRLDEDTKALLDDAYNRLLPGRTVLFLPSRLSTVRRCDQVVFVHNGRPEAIGTHSELLKQSDHYRHWEYVTFNAFRRKSDSGTKSAS
jgi:ABC-type multidrug transport system fused ATPase/permease subunit